jgi:3-oxoacyl-[acyl-carrier protein] reductase
MPGIDGIGLRQSADIATMAKLDAVSARQKPVADGGLRDKGAIVTGAASGIGRATAQALVSAGARVIGFDLKPSRADVFETLAVDVASEQAVACGIAEAVGRLGTFDILVNSAGIEIMASLAELDIAALDQMYAVNIRGTVLVTRAALPHLRHGARIINLASDLAYLGRAGSSGYCATKGAILSLTRSWARELGPHILVNAIAPGPTDTALLHFQMLPPKLQALELANPLARIGRPEEIAAAILFLAGTSGSFITGQCLGVDGGAAMH